MANILLYIATVTIIAEIICNLILIQINEERFRLVLWMTVILLFIGCGSLVLSLKVIPAEKTDYTESSRQYELIPKENNVYAVHGTERGLLSQKKKMTVRYIESPGVEKEKDLYEWETRRIKTGNPKLVVVTYKKREGFYGGRIPDTEYILYLPEGE